MTIILNFNVKQQKLKRLDKQVIVNKSRNVVLCNFLFEDEENWKNIPKFVIFTNDKNQSYTSKLDESMECRCTIPSPAMTGKFMKITVYGGDLITTNVLKVLLLPSGYTTNIEVAQPDKKDVFVEIFESLESKIDNIRIEDGFLKCYSKNKLLHETPIFLKETLEDEIRELIPYFKIVDGDLIVVYP